MANQSAEQPKKQRVKLHGSQGQIKRCPLWWPTTERAAQLRENLTTEYFQLKVSNMMLSYPEFEFVKSGALREPCLLIF